MKGLLVRLVRKGDFLFLGLFVRLKPPLRGNRYGVEVARRWLLFKGLFVRKL